MDPHRVVRDGYDAIAERYAAASLEARADGTYYRAFVDGCLERLTPGSRILDLGCGAGIVAADLARRGRVIGIDLSFGQLRLARERVPRATLVQADMTALALREGSLDAVAAFWSIIHVRRERHAGLLAEIRTWLRPGGIFFGTLGSGDNPRERDDDFFGAPMVWSHFDADTNRRLLADAGWRVELADVVEDMDERHLWMLASA
jgi:SAM-dependent methyltransferase